MPSELQLILIDGVQIPTPRTAKHLFERYTIEKYFDDPEGLTELGTHTIQSSVHTHYIQS